MSENQANQDKGSSTSRTLVRPRRVGLTDLAEQLGKLPPQAVEMEEAIIGAMMLERDCLPQVIEILKPGNFYKEANNVIFDSILQLYKNNDPIDIKTVVHQLRKNGQLELVGGAYYVSELTTKINSAANIVYHAVVVKEQHLRREYIRVTSEIQQKAYEDTEDFFDLQNYANINIDRISDESITNEPEAIGDLAIDAMDQTEARKKSKDEKGYTGVPSGLSPLDAETGGWQNSDLIVIAARPGMGKALSVNELVLTENGWIPIGSVKVGDQIAGSHGKFINVSGVYPQGLREEYIVWFDDNTSVICDIDHLWTTKSRPERKYGKPESTKTLREIIDSGIILQGKRKNHSIRVCKPIEYPKIQLYIDPYLLGMLLGDGGLGSPLRLHNSEPDIIDKVRRISGFELNSSKKKDWNIVNGKGKEHPLRVDLEKYGLLGLRSYEKFIPEDYKRTCVEDRIKLLQGLIDSDGYVTGGCRIEYSTTSHRLASDVIDLVRSLGGIVRYSDREGSYTKNGTKIAARKNFRIFITLPEHIVPVSSKKHLAKYKYVKQFHQKFIVKVEATKRLSEMVCIKVDSDDSLFLTTGYTLTHNTAFIISNLRNTSLRFGIPTLIFSLEMSKLQLVNRFASMEGEIAYDNISKGSYTPNGWEKYSNAMNRLAKAPIFIDDTPGIGILELKTKARRMVQKHKVGLIVVDYLQLMKGAYEGRINREQEISSITRGLKELAKELDVPIIALSQLSRDVEKRGGDKIPKLSDLRESGSIEQDADIVAFLYRAAYYGLDKNSDGTPTHDQGEIIISKHRNGELKNLVLRFVGWKMEWSDPVISSMDSGPQNVTVQKPSNDFSITLPKYPKKPIPPEVGEEDMPF